MSLATTVEAPPRPLPTTLNKHGYQFTQVEREGTFAIYAQSRDERVYAYETIKITTAKARTVFNNEVPAMEKYPADSDWGKLAHTHSCYGRSEVETLTAWKAAKAQMAAWVAAAREAAIGGAK